MKKQKTPFAKRLRQFKYFSKKVNRLLLNGDFQLLSSSKQDQLITTLRKRYEQIRVIYSSAKLRKVLAGAALLLSMSPISQAQSFGPPQSNPFNINTVNNYVFQTFVDIDNDGDLDLFISGIEEYSKDPTALKFLENIGSSTSPFFAQETHNPFGIQVPEESITFIDFADIDNDGDQDLFMGGSEVGFSFLENIGTSEVPEFDSPQANPFGFIIGDDEVIYPIFADLDNDGDLDLVVSEYYGALKYYENTGTSSAAEFAAPIDGLFGIDTETEGAIVAFFDLADLDNDGDLDLFYSVYLYDNGTTISYSENTGTAEEAQFSTPISDPFGIETISTLEIPTFGDLDNDGDLDLLMGQYYGNITFYENLDIDTNIPPLAVNNTIAISEDFTNPFLIENFTFSDFDGDALASIEIASLPAIGLLQYLGSDVTIGQVINASDIPNLTYSPLADEFGDNYTSFEFKVSDGEFTSTESALLTIDVLPVNDAPSASDNSILMLNNETYAFSEIDFNFSDIDGSVIGVQISSLPTEGTLQYNGLDVTLNQNISASTLASLVFTPDGVGTPYSSFGFKVYDESLFSVDEYTMTVNVDFFDSTSDLKLEGNLNLYPNPATDYLTVQLDLENLVSDIQVEVINNLGQQIISFQENINASSLTKQIDIKHLAAGSYQLKITSNSKLMTSTFVKK